MDIPVKARNPRQEEYGEGLKDLSVPLVVAAGEAGVGKTLWACEVAAALYRAGWIKKIIMTRPVVPVGEGIGFLPGPTKDKMSPWVAPMKRVFEERLGKSEVATMEENGTLAAETTGTLRGHSWKHTFVICDEAQNLTQ